MLVVLVMAAESVGHTLTSVRRDVPASNPLIFLPNVLSTVSICGTPSDSFHVARFPVVVSKISVIPHFGRDGSIDVLRVVIETAISYYIGNSLSSRSIPLDAVVRLRLLLAHQPQPHVALDLGTVALGGVAEAAAARHLDHQAFAGRNGLEALGLEFLA